MNQLKVLLSQRGLKQVDLVKKLGIDPGRISMQINGVRNLPLKYQVQLAEILGVQVVDLAIPGRSNRALCEGKNQS